MKRISFIEYVQTVLQHINICHSNTDHICTDGSKSERGVGFAVVFPTTYVEYVLPSLASIFTAELQAIWAALYHILHSPGTFSLFFLTKSAL